MKLRWFAFLIVLLAGCSSKHDYTNPPWNAKVPVQRAMQWMPISQKAGAAWGVDPQLITAIIAIESGGNPNAVSKSNAIGLMQLKLQPPDVMFIGVWAGVVSRRPAS